MFPLKVLAAKLAVSDPEVTDQVPWGLDTGVGVEAPSRVKLTLVFDRRRLDISPVEVGVPAM
jgi:hypothetical protein